MARVRGVARVCDGAFGVSDLDEDALWEAYAASVVAREVATEDDAAAPVEDVDVRDLTRGRRLADDRTLDVLDWPAVRALVARETTTDRATARANALVPHVDLDVVRLEQRATAEMRALATDSAIEIPRVREVGEPVARAARGGLLGADELRDIGIALAAADAAVRRIRASDAPTLQARAAGASPLPEVAAAIDRAIGERGDVLDRASPALARIRRNAVHAQDDARDRCAAILRSPRYAKAIQDAIVPAAAAAPRSPQAKRRCWARCSTTSIAISVSVRPRRPSRPPRRRVPSASATASSWRRCRAKARSWKISAMASSSRSAP
ncbi:MAG: hypothetical protein NVSMB59_09140 [Vulcanimicrobiaceae bacterium]